MNIIAEFDYVNATEGHRIGKDEALETRFETKGELFRFCQKEYGRCVSKVYVEKLGQEDRPVGWVFEKNVKYSDVNETYLQETWVTIHSALPEHKTICHYADI